MARNKALIMNDYKLEKAFNHFKDRPEIQEALENGYKIYLRPNGFLIVKFSEKGLSKTKLAKIEKNYKLFN